MSTAPTFRNPHGIEVPDTLSDVADVAGNASDETKAVVKKWLWIFGSRGGPGFADDVNNRVAVREVSIIPKVAEPQRKEGRVVTEITVEKALSWSEGGDGEPGVSQAINTVFHAPAPLCQIKTRKHQFNIGRASNVLPDRAPPRNPNTGSARAGVRNAYTRHDYHLAASVSVDYMDVYTCIFLTKRCFTAYHIMKVRNGRESGAKSGNSGSEDDDRSQDSLPKRKCRRRRRFCLTNLKNPIPNFLTASNKKNAMSSTVDIEGIEKSLIQGNWTVAIPDASSPAITHLAKKVVDGSFRDVLTSSSAREIFTTVASNVSEKPIDALLHQSGPPDREGELLRLTLAVACLHAFVQVNWTGPDLDVKPLDVLVFTDAGENSPEITEEFLNAKAVAELAYGGEPAYHLAQCATLLRLAQALLALPYQHCSSTPWWNLRAAVVHEKILDEPVALPPTVLSALKPLDHTFASSPDLAGRLILEEGLLDHLLRNDRSAAEYFVKAARATGLQYELTGALGKRTKFQQTDHSQLVLLAESRLQQEESPPSITNASAEDTDPVANVPDTLALNDDTLLEQTEFTSSASSDPNSTSQLAHLDPSAQPALHPLDQCILLSLCLNVRNTSPAHGLTSEQMAPYVTRVISHPRNWSVHTMALLLRSRLEASRTRTAERSTLQLQALVDQMPTADSTLAERLRYFHSIPLPSKWELEKELAMRFLSLGVVKSALEIFERLEMWEEVVTCWQAMERQDKAVSIVRDLLEGRKEEADTVLARNKSTSETRRRKLDTAREAKLWCILGDLEPENAYEHYSHAWTISGKTSGRAMRSLGGFYFARGEFIQAIPYLKRAVAINPLLSRSWFVLGCAYVREENWEGARDAFSRCVAIDDEDGESWNNLASMYLRMGAAGKQIESGDRQPEGKADLSLTEVNGDAKTIPFSNKMLAFRALKQGLKFSYDNWRMWSNYMIVAMDVGELSEACRAVGRVVEERSTKDGAAAVDEDVLERLVDAVTRAPANADEAVEGSGNANTAVRNPNEGHGLHRRVLDLFDRTILPRVSSTRIFRAYARLLTWQARWEEALKAYLDGYRCSTAGTMQKGETDVERWREAVGEVEDIVGVLTNFGPRVEGSKWKLQARSIVRTFVGRTKDFEDEPEWERLTALLEDLRNEE
ncbi:hypothetical protein PLICRDRAFT_25481 [Plicaturopsis crispa FD-325 SS-3]|nr:hypothetical protein PLICRDRAFT_25481 [Plicaturopsis crispa FD-325 SS-3]